MVHIELKKSKNKKYEWWVKDDEDYCLGFESFKDLKHHFKSSLKIDKNKKVTVIDEDKLLEDIVFI